MPSCTQKMMFALSLGLIGMMLAANIAHSSPPNCAKRASMIEQLRERYGESRQSVGLTPSGHVLETYAHPETGTWTILLTFPNGNSCMMASRQAYQYLNEPSGQGA